MNDIQQPSDKTKSNFVTVLAWIFIVLGCFSTLISALQNIMVQTIFSDPEFSKALMRTNQSKDMPAIAEFMFNNFRLIVAAFFVVSVMTLASAIGLLQRKNWARLVFIAIMVFGIIWNLGSCCFQIFMFSSLSSAPANADQAKYFQTFATAVMFFSVILAVGFSALFGWIVKRLVSQPIRHEFGVA